MGAKGYFRTGVPNDPNDLFRLSGFPLPELPTAIVLAGGRREARFFGDCPRRPRVRVHHEGRASDPHAVLQTAANLMQIEVIRLADWILDLPIPGHEVRPIGSTIDAIRSGYYHMGHGTAMRRVSELVDSLQLRELSLGDVAASSGSGGAGIGSGTLLRVNRLIDWTQRVLGDLNGLAGRPFGRDEGLVPGQVPAVIVDNAQVTVNGAFHIVSIGVAKTMDASVTGMERGAEGLANMGRPIAHRQQTVFLRMTPEVYGANESWIHRNRSRIYAGTPEELAGLSHAEIFHPRSRRRSADWWSLARFNPPPQTIILITDRRTFDRAPDSLRPYVVPAAWVLDRSPSPTHRGGISSVDKE